MAIAAEPSPTSVAADASVRATSGLVAYLDGEPVNQVGELHVGSRGIFAAAGFAEVSHPTLRRVVMRIDF